MPKLIEYIPLQQGLRQGISYESNQEDSKLIEYIPLQQGLRLFILGAYFFAPSH